MKNYLLLLFSAALLVQQEAIIDGNADVPPQDTLVDTKWGMKGLNL